MKLLPSPERKYVPMEKYGTLLSDLYTRTVEYARMQAKMGKMHVYERLSTLISESVTWLVFGILSLLALVLMLVAAAIWLGEVTGSIITGFAVAGLFLALMASVFYLFREAILGKHVRNSALAKLSRVYSDHDVLLEEIGALGKQIAISEAALKVQFNELKENLEELNRDLNRIKSRFVSTTNDEGERVGPRIPRVAITSALEFLLSNVLFPRAGLIKKMLMPVVANTLVTSALFKEKKKTSLLENLKVRFAKFLT